MVGGSGEAYEGGRPWCGEPVLVSLGDDLADVGGQSTVGWCRHRPAVVEAVVEGAVASSVFAGQGQLDLLSQEE